MCESLQPIRVLHILRKLGSGGVEKLLVSLMENMDRKTIAFDFLLTSNEKGFYDEYVQELGAKLHYLDIGQHNGKFMQKVARHVGFYRFMRKGKYSIVHLHGTQPITYVNAFLAKKAGVECVILHAHATKSLTRVKTKILPIFKFLFGKYPSYYIACSQEAADYMWPNGLEKDKGCVLINGIDFGSYAFSETRRSLFRKENNLEGKYVVGHIGRFAETKNHRFLLKVFKRVQEIIPNCVLLMIGEGALKKNIQEMADAMGIRENVVFFGTTKDIPSALMGMDVFCFPSFFEGLGIVVVEAQAASLPVVVSEGVPESANISRFFNKLQLNDPLNVWAEKVAEFNWCEERSELSWSMKHAEYDIRTTVEKLTDVYKILLHQKSHKKWENIV